MTEEQADRLIAAVTVLAAVQYGIAVADRGGSVSLTKAIERIEAEVDSAVVRMVVDRATPEPQGDTEVGADDVG